MWPLLLFAILVVLIEWSGFDLIVADWIYILEGNQWRLKTHFITSTLLHESGRLAIQIIALLFFCWRWPVNLTGVLQHTNVGSGCCFYH